MTYISNNNIFFTSEGGLAIKVINKTGSNSIKGLLVSTSTTQDNSIILTPVGNPDPIGCFYESGIPDGEKVLIVKSGIAEVFYYNGATRGNFARMMESGDSNAASGRAISTILPTPPFSTDKHFQEIGHILETVGTQSLAKTVLHFN